MKKKLFVLLVAATMIFAFTGCGSEPAEAPEDTSTSVTEEVTDDATEEATEEATEDATEAPTEDATEAPAEDTTKDTAKDIGTDKATEIALKDAGLKKADVEFTKQQADVDDGVNIYEIEFTSGETKYEYDIDAATGKILDRDSDSIYDD